MFMGYNLKLDKRTVKLEKKNGSEQKQLDQLKERVTRIEKTRHENEPSEPKDHDKNYEQR